MVKMLPKKPVATGNGASTVAVSAPAKTIPEVAALPSTFTVRRTYAVSGETTEDETEHGVIEVNRFQTDVARVRASASYKRNVRKYETAEVYYAVELPCYVEEIDAAFDRANEIVTERLSAALEAMGESVSGVEDEVEAIDDEPEAEVEGVADDEEEGISEEEVMSYTHEQLIELVTGNELAVDPEEFADNPKGLAKFRAAVWESIVAAQDEAPDEEEAAAEEEAVEEEAAAEAEADEPYTKEELAKLTLEQLEKLRTDWEMPDIKIPRGAKDKGKGAYIKAILDFQAAYQAQQEGEAE
jgi:hypothetical protein